MSRGVHSPARPTGLRTQPAATATDAGAHDAATPSRTADAVFAALRLSGPGRPRSHSNLRTATGRARAWVFARTLRAPRSLRTDWSRHAPLSPNGRTARAPRRAPASTPPDPAPPQAVATGATSVGDDVARTSAAAGPQETQDRPSRRRCPSDSVACAARARPRAASARRLFDSRVP
ncbi:hypothetical protein D9M72_500380 [compost metagenome]